VEPLSLTKESYELIFRHGQKTERYNCLSSFTEEQFGCILPLHLLSTISLMFLSRYFETKVEHFAPYLLKDGLVQKVTKFENNLPDAEEVSS
jgi:hypothetical protein